MRRVRRTVSRTVELRERSKTLELLVSRSTRRHSRCCKVLYGGCIRTSATSPIRTWLGTCQAKHIIKAVKGLQYRTCQVCQKPASARPAKPVPVLDFNDVLGIDVIHVEDALKKKKHRLLSMVDYGSTYHIVRAIKD